MIHISILPEYHSICQQFSENVVETNLDEYKRRRQFNKSKIIKDIYQGKIVELAIARTIGCQDPDFNVYSSKKKSYSCDLKHNGMDLHIKSQHEDVSKKYGESWVFQRSDKLTYKPKESDHLIFALVNNESVIVKGLYKAESLVDYYKPTRLPHLTSKCCIYFEDIKDIPALSLFEQDRRFEK